MPLGKLMLKAGVDVIETPTLNEAQLTASMCIRFYKGLVEKRGGWVARTVSITTNVINALKGWADLASNPWLGIGTDRPDGPNLFVLREDGTVLDITPSPAPASPVEWSFDNYGEVLIAAPQFDKIYAWTPPTPPAVAIGGSSPVFNASILVVPQVQILLSLGSEIGGVFNGLLLRWSDAGDYTSWTPTATNQAGSYVIPQGSYIVGGLASGLAVLIWTDVGVTAMTYQGLPFVFGFQPIATGCGLFGERALGVIGTYIMWLGGPAAPGAGLPTQTPIGFFRMTLGATPPIPMECPVWDIFVSNANFGEGFRLFMAVTEQFNEFELFFPLATTSSFYQGGVIEWGSIKYNTLDNAWDYNFSAQLQRTAWEHSSPVGSPVGGDIAGLIQQHEVGFDANTEAMSWSWRTGDFDLGNGEEMIFVDWLIPDFNTLDSSNPPTISLTVGASASPNSTPITATQVVTSATEWTANFGLRGRQFFIGASGSDRGTFNRLGAIRYRAAPDGRGP